ncbi:HAMP domain-containing sensor histidine kinase [Actinoplanes sp. NPDC051411]|uniref:sensor histidine kinase n=1 Tax=Actinoplanes sp. NPDC051411 TaxID=3155522 RepID=UPI00342C0404
MNFRRHRLRVQLTLLYAIPFFATGVVLSSIPLFGARSTAQAGSTPPPQAQTEIETNGSFTSRAIALGVLTVLSLLVGWWVAGRFVRPLRTLTATAREISATNLDRRLDLADRKDEYGELAETLDDLFARLGAAFESQRRFVANASHELRTPLTAERALLQVALADPAADPEQLRRACGEVLALGRRQERLIDALLTLASSEQGVERRLPFDLGALVSEAIDARRDDAASAGIRLTTTVSAAPVVGDPNLVGSLVANLLDNALRHNVPEGRVEVAVGGNTLSVGNDGPVVPAAEVDGLFEPFRQLGGERIGNADGHGLGLAIVRAIADAHGAALTAAPRTAGGGLEIAVTFPPAAS